MESQTIQESIFADEANLEMASRGQRFANYLIDLFTFYVVAIILFGAYFVLFPGSYSESASPGASYVQNLVSLVLYGLYMGTIEAVFKGKTLGKMITGTKAVNEDGSEITAGTAFLRGLSRAVPFSVFSALGAWCHPWHDRWTNTYVIDVKKSHIPLGK
ncbi:RDD family protein [Chitinophaga arvensicola]|uniref:Uncharacterized membrane protein YckC, RDD family n=1 Tax=Chitinophaga arvensicola TaxID=29529 RepID=A0A1I0RR05_9BACT|nr:RDD family protein [Chitinophaga arvensicola]SEW43729.1 Uncharacterized membrane protein YckC, RDD family [Chitinophaga arvensicola]